MRITALSGGVGGARFLRGLREQLRERAGDGPVRDEVTVVGNTGDDITLFGLRVCPDLDSVLYTLGGAVHEGQGWGRADDGRLVQAELAELGVEPQWFGLGDKDLATHIARSLWLGQGQPMSEVTRRLATRWGLPEQGFTLLPMTDSAVETHVVLASTGGCVAETLHFQQWWVQRQAKDPVERFVVVGVEQSEPAPGVLAAIRDADVILLPPSNPVVSIGVILEVPGIRQALRESRAPVVGVSPIVGGRPVRGHADACLSAIGVPTTATAVAGLYADFLDGWLVDEADEPSPRPPGQERADSWVVRRRPLLMPTVAAAGELAGAALDLALELAADPARAGRP